MSRITLLQPETILRKMRQQGLQLRDGEEKLFLDMYKLYRKNSIIYPGVIVRETKIDYERVYSILLKFASLGLLTIQYEIMCNKCKETTGEIYSNPDEIPEYSYCNICDEEIIAIKNALVEFRVV